MIGNRFYFIKMGVEYRSHIILYLSCLTMSTGEYERLPPLIMGEIDISLFVMIDPIINDGEISVKAGEISELHHF